MRVTRPAVTLLAIALLSVPRAVGQSPGAAPSAVTIDYPEDGSIFPPEITPPTFLWRDPVPGASAWRIDIEFADGSPALRVFASGEGAPAGEIDPRAIGPTNELPKATPEQALQRSWIPDAAAWESIKRHSVDAPAAIAITGFRAGDREHPLSSGRVTVRTSRDPVGAPIFYRDVPLMPSELEKGVIKPLAQSAIPLIAWRLRDIAQPQSRIVLEGMHTCANCHSFSRDGRTLGMDVDGPENDKGTYAIAPVRPRMSIATEDVITWNSFPAKVPGQRTIGFLSQISPDGQYAVSTVNESVYVANFKDYRFLQVFYPTRGILALYSRASRKFRALPGADDPRYVHTDAVWSPDGQYLVFARAAAKDPYPAGSKLAECAGDPNETPIQYDLYRIPFNGGKGGRPEPLPGASRNGMSNSFPKISPDGRWIVFVEARNGQLMRPDSRLYIMPASGGTPRLMRCNTRLMNSWHSFSPNGRWMVFSSKSRGPYTRMFLTHVDENGNDSPPILIENATAANRAVNIPEFVNILPDGLLSIAVPAADFYTVFDRAVELAQAGRYGDAIAEWNKALRMNPAEPKVHNNLGVALMRTGKPAEAVAHFRAAVAERPGYADAHYNLAGALALIGNPGEAMTEFRHVLEIDPRYAAAHNDLGVALLGAGKPDEAMTHFRKALEIEPRYAEAHNNFGAALARRGHLDEALREFRLAIAADPKYTAPHYSLGMTLYSMGRMAAAVSEWREALRLDPNDAPVLLRLAWVLATCPQPAVRNGGEALELAERAAARRLDQPEALDTLAAAYAELGRYPAAVAAERRAIALATAQKKAPLARAAEARIGLYEANRPYHAP